jgi:hypothetical protein
MPNIMGPDFHETLEELQMQSQEQCPKSTISSSLSAFEKDLTQLLTNHKYEWVAYAKGEQLKIAETQTELYRHCLNELHLSHDEFIVRCIVPETGPEVESTLR